MDMLTRPDVSREKLLDVIPSLNHLDESLRERLVIEGKYIQNTVFIAFFLSIVLIQRYIYLTNFTLECKINKILGRYKPFLKRQEAEVAALKRDENLKLDINLEYSA